MSPFPVSSSSNRASEVFMEKTLSLSSLDEKIKSQIDVLIYLNHSLSNPFEPFSKEKIYYPLSNIMDEFRKISTCQQIFWGVYEQMEKIRAEFMTEPFTLEITDQWSQLDQTLQMRQKNLALKINPFVEIGPDGSNEAVFLDMIQNISYMWLKRELLDSDIEILMQFERAVENFFEENREGKSLDLDEDILARIGRVIEDFCEENDESELLDPGEDISLRVERAIQTICKQREMILETESLDRIKIPLVANTLALISLQIIRVANPICKIAEEEEELLEYKKRTKIHRWATARFDEILELLARKIKKEEGYGLLSHAINTLASSRVYCKSGSSADWLMAPFFSEKADFADTL